MRICVFCGSSSGQRPEYTQAAQAFGTALAQSKIGLVYGGGCVGLMGAVADAVLAAGGEVVGVIPQALWDKEVGHRGLSQLHIVDSMHQRKAMMAELADAFVALPGGIGTFEELFEIWTWAQLGIHQKAIGLLNVAGYYNALLSFIAHAQDQGFVRLEHAQMALVDSDPQRLIAAIQAYRPTHTAKWLEPDQT